MADMNDSSRRGILAKLGVGAAALVAGSVLEKSAKASPSLGPTTCFSFAAQGAKPAANRESLGVAVQVYGGGPTAAGTVASPFAVVKAINILTPAEQKTFKTGLNTARTTVSMLLAIGPKGIEVTGFDEIYAAAAANAAAASEPGRCSNNGNNNKVVAL